MLIYLSVSWLIGIYLASQVDLPLLVWGLATIPPLLTAWLWRKTPPMRLTALCLLLVTFGAVRYTIAIPHFTEHSAAFYNDQGRATLTGVVAAEPDVRDTYVNLRVRVETLAIKNGDQVHVKGDVLVRAPRYPEIAYGDRIAARGQLEDPPVFDTFSYRDYLAHQGIYSMMRWAQIDVLAHDRGNPLLALLLRFRRHAQHIIAVTLHEPSASLLTGILLGVESGIPVDLTAAFSATGTSHIIAISGFNISIISGVVTMLGVRLVGRKHAAWFSTVAIVLYMIFVGASASVARAALMGCVAIWGQHFGRQNSTPNALMATALLITAWNPHTLWDMGFLLSFAATIGLILFADPFQRGFEGLLARLLPAAWAEPVAKFLNESLVLTTCAQLTTLPIIIYNFRKLSLVSLLSNLLALPAQPQVMLWGGLATIGGLLWLPLGRAIGWVAWLFLSYTIWVVEATARLSHASLDLGWVDPKLIWAWYGALAGATWLFTQTVEQRRQWWHTLTRLSAKLLIGGAAVVVILTWIAASQLPDRRLHVTFLDVHEGVSVFIETPDGKRVLVDGGSSPAAILAHLGRRMPFWNRTLDMVVSTDPQDQYLAGLIAVIERYQIAQVLQSTRPCDSANCIEWQSQLQQKGISVQPGAAGTQLDLGNGVIVTVLHSESTSSAQMQPAGEENPLILRIDYGQACFLLAGSAIPEVEAMVMAREERVRCDVLYISQAANVTFLGKVNPALVVVSSGNDQDSSADVLEELSQTVAIVHTDQHGSIEVISDGAGYQVKTGP